LIDAWINYNDTIIGFIANNMFYYFKEMSIKEAMSYRNIKQQKMLYNPININNMISNIKSGKLNMGIDKDIFQKLQYCLYDYYVYNLLILQFISFFNKQRNEKFRKKLIDIIIDTNFSKNTDNIKDIINQINDLEDSNKLKKIIYSFISENKDKKEIIEDIDNTYFNFDRVELEELKTMEYKDVLKRLIMISKDITKKGDIHKDDNFKIENILVPCSKGSDTDYCDNTKFIIKPDKLEELLSILANDIINPLKWKWLFNSIFIDKIIDEKDVSVFKKLVVEVFGDNWKSNADDILWFLVGKNLLSLDKLSGLFTKQVPAINLVSLSLGINILSILQHSLSISSDLK